MLRWRGSGVGMALDKGVVAAMVTATTAPVAIEGRDLTGSGRRNGGLPHSLAVDKDNACGAHVMQTEARCGAGRRREWGVVEQSVVQ